MYASPLRYPGGKGKLAPFLMLVVEQNGLLDGEYAEPYAGGAAVAFSLLFREYVTDVHINDINVLIYAFWHSVLHDTEGLCRLIRDTPVNMDSWETQREIQISPKLHSRLELGFSTFFLNRTTRSGILDGGVIGGKNQDGPWKLDARFNKNDLVSRIQKIGRYSDRVHLHNMDAVEFIKKVLPGLPKKTLVYLDPPYYSKGKDLYENHYQPQDHAAVAKIVSTRIKHKWIVSYDNAPAIGDLYQDHRRITYNLSYSAGDRYSGAEIMFFSDDLVIPDVEQPARLIFREGVVKPNSRRAYAYSCP